MMLSVLKSPFINPDNSWTLAQISCSMVVTWATDMLEDSSLKRWVNWGTGRMQPLLCNHIQ